MKWPKFSKMYLDEKNRMIRCGGGLNNGRWFFRIDLWSVGFRISKPD